MPTKSTPEEGRARWIQGWGPGGSVPNKPLTTPGGTKEILEIFIRECRVSRQAPADHGLQRL